MSRDPTGLPGKAKNLTGEFTSSTEKETPQRRQLRRASSPPVPSDVWVNPRPAAGRGTLFLTDGTWAGQLGCFAMQADLLPLAARGAAGPIGPRAPVSAHTGVRNAGFCRSRDLHSLNATGTEGPHELESRAQQAWNPTALHWMKSMRPAPAVQQCALGSRSRIKVVCCIVCCIVVVSVMQKAFFTCRLLPP